MNPSPDILRVDAVHPEAGHIEKAARNIREGGLVIFPTRCLYGLGALAADPTAIRRVFNTKARPARKALLLLMDHAETLTDWVAESVALLHTPSA